MHKIVLILTSLIFVLVTSCKSQNNKNPETQKFLDKVKSDFVFIEGGTFLMGSNRFPEASPTHDVTIDSYSISKYETTFEEYDFYTKINKLDKVAAKWRDQDGMGPKYAAWNMTWNQAREYCQWLGKQLDLPIDLPTEAQWEYAARNKGLPVEHATNNGKIEGGENDNYASKEPVGIKPPSPIGLYDMSGGIQEWTLDWYGNYRSKPLTNPTGKDIGDDYEGQEKVVRGWHNLTNTTVTRGHRPVESTGTAIGIRCVCNQKTPIN